MSVEDMNKKALAEPVEAEVIPSDVGGAPTKYTPVVVGKLVASFHNGYNITEACQYAGINRDTYYEWLASQPGFSDKMEEAKAMPNRKAKEVVMDAINNGDANLAFRMLERRDPDFKPTAAIDNTHELAQTRSKIKDFLDEPTDYSESNAGGAEPSASDATSGGDEVAEPTPDIS